MAGFFYAFAIDVAPALANLDARSYITTQQWINSVVRNAIFAGTYFGAAVIPFATAAAVVWCGRRGPGIAWLVVALAYFVAVFWITRTVNVPINNELASWQPAAPPLHWQQARDSWNQSNLVRTIAAVACFLSSVVLVAVSRSTTARLNASQGSIKR